MQLVEEMLVTVDLSVVLHREGVWAVPCLGSLKRASSGGSSRDPRCHGPF